ncbi:MAG TPA: threonine ammonia-lyase, biosynthetic, partial [Cellvibrionaceae bacterium]|nr:threonine ammonia-lyase, biosynthetic [Cellvibrionaceae bacterium]
AAAHLGVNATIVMPRTTPAIKVDAVKRRGARVELQGDSYDEAAAFAKQLVAQQGMVYIHPFDDPDVIAGQGTVAMEILRQHPHPLDAVFIPVGGGGLCAGMAAYIKYLRSDVKVFAVESEDSACLAAAMASGERSVLSQVGLFADGIAVAQIGEETFRVLRDCIDGVITVSSDEICAAIKDIFEDNRSITEPAGAAALAGLKKYIASTGVSGQSFIAIDSGANTNFDRLRYISERTEISENREAILAVTIPERPGSYLEFCSLLGKRAITEFNYRFQNAQENAHIFVGLQISPERGDRQDLIQRLHQQGYEVTDLSDNEMAKLHIRHMVGGRAPSDLADELLMRFEFPERPGALLQFLSKLAGRWNISLFHYRNHGAAFGRVLVGMQVPAHSRAALITALEELGYPFWDESQNPAYRLFLA